MDPTNENLGSLRSRSVCTTYPYQTTPNWIKQSRKATSRLNGCLIDEVGGQSSELETYETRLEEDLVQISAHHHQRVQQDDHSEQNPNLSVAPFVQPLSIY